MNIESTRITLEEIVRRNDFFSIPIYQRLYVWEEDQVKTLLEDIETAFDDHKDLFYLGGVLVVENHPLGRGRLYDLIDGQQRFTTLWMIAIVFAHALKPFIEQNAGEEKSPRISFAIRDDINQFFKERIAGQNDLKSTKQIANALAVIEHYKTQFKEKGKLEELASFIFEKVTLIFTAVPKQTDLNKLFQIINNRGVQLQHHEILKARLLNKIPAEERSKYSYLWDACSVMGQYVEKSIRDIVKVKITNLFDKEASIHGEEELANPKKVLQAMEENKNNDVKPRSLLHILQADKPELETDKTDILEDYEADDVRSIITFPMILLHTLRIFLVNKQRNDIEKISDKELLKIFSEHFLCHSATEEVKEFIELLWQVRYSFDKHVIKWIKSEDGETHLICKLEKTHTKNYVSLVRKKTTSNAGEALLQSMLYHSQQITTHYWLTPYLKYLIDKKGQGSFQYLKHLDNHLFCSVEKESLVIRTRRFLENPYYTAKLSKEELKRDLGTGFPHYWFYKLEFVLWETYAANKGDKWKNFKMTAKNSVEHISPRTQQDTDINTVSNNMLNHFGNLALVSQSINSEYSNKPFNEKREQFRNKNRDKLDSLKMELIYSNESWSDELALRHQDHMFSVLNQYLNLED
jgi:uncharacterized protein with ParB-like and HNH nuclease domain